MLGTGHVGIHALASVLVLSQRSELKNQIVSVNKDGFFLFFYLYPLSRRKT